MWSCPVKSFHSDRKAVALKSVRCALDLLQEIGQYNSGTGDKAVSLRLHCGMSVGTLFCMSLGSPTRMEFLISGPVLAEVGIAESEADTGELCLSGSAYTLVATEFNAEVKPKGSIRIASVRKKEVFDSSGSLCCCLPMHRRVLPRAMGGMRGRRNPKIYIDTGAVEELGGDNSASIGFLEHVESGNSSGKFGNALLHQLTSAQSEAQEYKKAFSRYVHESVRNVIDGSSSGHEAELRDVTTMFIQLVNLDEDFNTGKHQRPQQAILEVLDVLARVGGGALRQYVVDDKGCVVICCFGVPGFSSSNNNVRAISAAMKIRDGLKNYDILCQIGIASGMVYCGYVGSKYRKEYSMMGSSVNLAARLMAKSEVSQILVDSHVHIDSQDEFAFDTLPPIQAKGYADAVNVYCPTAPAVNAGSTTLEEMARRSSTIKSLGLVGRSFELSVLSNALKKYVLSEETNKYAAEGFARLDNSLSSNKFVIIGGPRFGTSRSNAI
jgi:class 3 adenylate cyclase